MANQRRQLTKVCVTNLASDVTEIDMFGMFHSYGPIRKLYVIRDEEGNSSRFGFVIYDRAEDAQRAVDDFDGENVGGQILHLSQSTFDEGDLNLLSNFRDSQRRRRSTIQALPCRLHEGVDWSLQRMAIQTMSIITEMITNFFNFIRFTRNSREILQSLRPSTCNQHSRNGESSAGRNQRLSGNRRNNPIHLSSHVERNHELTAETLAAHPPKQQIEMLADRLLPLVQVIHSESAATITAMLLEDGYDESLHLLNSESSFRAAVEEKVSTLQSYRRRVQENKRACYEQDN